MSSARDRHIDCFRGLALLCILIDHIPGNLFAGFTLQNLAYADAAEILVLLAGIAAAAGAQQRYRVGQWLEVVRWSIWRSLQLYMAHIAVVLATFAVLILAAQLLRNETIAELARLGSTKWTEWQTFRQLLSLGLQPDYLNILPLYVCFLAFLPALILAVRAAVLPALGFSAAIWMGAGYFAVNLPSATDSQGWYFNPLTWQFLFVIGLACWERRGDLDRLAQNAILVLLAAITAAVIVVAMAPWTQLPQLAHVKVEALSSLDPGSKTMLSAPRLLSILSLAFLAYAFRHRLSVLVDCTAGRWMQLLGRHSLSVYIAASLYDTLATVARLHGARGIVYQLAVNLIGFAVVTSVAIAMEWSHRHSATTNTVPRATARRLAAV